MEDEPLRGITLHSCPTCAATWAPLPEFWSLFHHAQPESQITELLVHNDGSPRRPCPRCGELMDIAWIDFLQLDQCTCGIWFDPTELDRALTLDVGSELADLLAKRLRRQRRREHRGNS